MSLSLHIPFDEPDGSLIAYDYSENHFNATITNGRFVKGREGNCVYFPGSGTAIISGQPVDLTGNFTWHGWFKAEINGVFPKNSYFRIRYSGDQNYLVIFLNTTLQIWTHIALVKDGHYFYSYVNGKLVQITNPGSGFDGDPEGFTLNTDDPRSGYGFCSIDNLYVLNDQVLGEQDFQQIISNAHLEMNFIINNKNFKDFGVIVENAKGLLGKLALKDPASYDWDEDHGLAVDLAKPRYQTRKIELDCWFKANGKDATIANMFALQEEFSKAGTIRLSVEIGSKPLIYECYIPEEIPFDPLRWRDNKMFTRFTLKLVELQPVKKVLFHIKTGISADASFTISTENVMNVYWGDGTFTPNVTGQNVTVSHHYTTYGFYYILIAGVIEDITAFTTNEVVVWNKLS